MNSSLYTSHPKLKEIIIGISKNLIKRYRLIESILYISDSFDNFKLIKNRKCSILIGSDDELNMEEVNRVRNTLRKSSLKLPHEDAFRIKRKNRTDVSLTVVVRKKSSLKKEFGVTTQFKFEDFKEDKEEKDDIPTVFDNFKKLKFSNKIEVMEGKKIDKILENRGYYDSDNAKIIKKKSSLKRSGEIDFKGLTGLSNLSGLSGLSLTNLNNNTNNNNTNSNNYESMDSPRSDSSSVIMNNKNPSQKDLLNVQNLLMKNDFEDEDVNSINMKMFKSRFFSDKEGESKTKPKICNFYGDISEENVSSENSLDYYNKISATSFKKYTNEFNESDINNNNNNNENDDNNNSNKIVICDFDKEYNKIYEEEDDEDDKDVKPNLFKDFLSEEEMFEENSFNSFLSDDHSSEDLMADLDTIK